MNLGIHMKNNNNFFSVIVLVVLFCASQLALADSHNIELKPGHPKTYTVQKGDTLWDIAGKFLNRPWYWPEIWHVNEQVENPHLIYPGDVLRLVYINGRPYITRDKYGKQTVRLSPRIRVEELDRAIPTIPLDIITPYLSRNRILNLGEFSGAPYIVGISENHMSAGADDSIYVMDLDKEPVSEKYGIYKKGKAYRNPAKKTEILGYEAIYLGEGVLDRKGNPATIYVEKSKAEILKGNRVISIATDNSADANFLPKSSLVNRPGTIIGVLTNGMQPGVNMVGAMDVVVIDMGIEDGAEVGDVLNIYKKGDVVKDPLRNNKSVKLPDEMNGNLMIFRTFKRLSYALVMDAQSDLRLGDIVKSPMMAE